MFEMIEIDPATGDEDQLICTGTMDELSELADLAREQAEDDGYDIPWIRIQPAQ